jgi:hypothetical protein
MELFKTSIILGVVFSLSSCYYDVAEHLYPGTACTTDNMSYQTHIVPILSNNCYICHSQAVNTGNITLEGYEELLPYINNGRLMGAIRHESGFVPMPQNASQMSECQIARIEAWIADGALNN